MLRAGSLAIGSAMALWVAGLSFGLSPVLAASPAVAAGHGAATEHAVAPTVSRLRPPGHLPAGPSRFVVGASTSVTDSALASGDRRAWPAVSPAPTAGGTRSAQLAGPTYNNEAYTALPPTRLLDTRTNGETLGPNTSLNLEVIGGSVPASATAVALNVTVTDTTAPSYLTVYPAGEALPLVSNLNWVSGETVPNLVIVPIGAGGQVTFYNDSGSTDVVVDLEGYFAPEPSNSTAGSYVPLTPARIADTRANSGEPYSGDTLSPGGSLNVQVGGVGGVPSSGVTAALMNVTVTNTTAPSYLTVYPQGGARPLASNLNWPAGDTVANRVVVPVNPSTGQISVYNDAGNTDVVIDVDGYFTNGAVAPSNASLFSTISPIRVLDTRQTGQTLGPGTSLTQQLGGLDGIAANATAVVTNVTATDTTAPSYFTVYPGGVQPLASDVNWSAGQTVPNLTVATLSTGGSITVYNDAGRADLVIDAFGYFGPRVPLTITTNSLPTGTVGTAYSATLTASGGTPPYSWQVTSGSLPGGLALASDGVVSGTPTVAGTSAFSVQVADSTAPTPATATTSLSLTVYLGPPSTASSQNWSGYVLQSGPYTSVTGTFNVPSIYASTTNTNTAEWVGIDGLYPDTSLIQAGIDEPYDASTNTYQIYAWWEILPADPTEVEIPCSYVCPSPGDSITVTINEISGTDWAINLTDNTNGESFTTDQSYSAPLSSAEWIVEAPMLNGAVETLGGYTPDVTFTGLGAAGPQNTLTDVVMVQNGVQVSTPSALDSTGFNVAYGDVAPSPP